MKRKLLFFLTCILTIKLSVAQIPYPGGSPGAAKVKILPDSSVILENNSIKMTFGNYGKGIRIEGFEDIETQERLEIGKSTLFELTLGDNSILTSDDFTLKSSPEALNITRDPKSKTYSERLGGKKYKAVFENKKLGLIVQWEADMKDGTNYVRQIFTFIARDTVNISKITLIKLPVKIGLEKKGTVDGSPLVHRNMFFAVEHPMSQAEQTSAFMSSFLLQLTPITFSGGFIVSTVWGTTPVGQLRRGFLYYTECERSTPYRQILHYNSWYDISWADTKFNETQALDRIRMFKDSLIIKRQIRLNAFLFDDGWDDNKTLWSFSSGGFPNGFVKMKGIADSCKSSLGVWMSPFGGYGDSKDKRIEFGKNQNPPFETNANGFSLSGPVYYQRFLNVARNFIQNYNISIFKFDGVGPGNDAPGAGITYHNDIEAFLRLLKELKSIKPDLYLDLTTGTWPSVYWLKYGDNTWRSGDDNGQAGEGSMRQQGITYRDANTYKNVVKAGPLYPLNALMNGGVIIADNGLPGKFEMNEKDISDDIWSFFGTGVSLQELYINPHKLSSSGWDCLAKASRWARENERIMADIHWIGGDPAKNEVYGYAAWSPEKAILMLRNPSKEEKSYLVNVNIIFELPSDIKSDYRFFDARKGGNDPLATGRFFRITLQPFEVKILNALPK